MSLTEPIISAHVLVAGAGPSGLAAALAAARNGTDTLLVDSHNEVGGTVTHAGICSVCGLFAPDRPYPEYRAGPEAIKWAKSLGGRVVRMGRLFALTLNPGAFSTTAWRFLDDCPSLDVCLGCRLKPGMHLRVKVLVDCTGCAGLARLLGRFIRQTGPACPALGFRIKGLDPKCLVPGCLDVLRRLEKEAPGCLFRLYPDFTDPREEIPGFLNLPPLIRPADQWPFYEEALRELKRILTLLRTNQYGFRRVNLAWVAEEICFRSGDTIVGEDTLDIEQALNKSSDQEQVRSWWPAEHWTGLAGPCFTYPASTGYLITDGCLISPGKPPLFAAGMSLSATSMGQASSRVIAACLDTGFRAGILAAKAASEGRTYDIHLVSERKDHSETILNSRF